MLKYDVRCSYSSKFNYPQSLTMGGSKSWLENKDQSIQHYSGTVQSIQVQSAVVTIRGGHRNQNLETATATFRNLSYHEAQSQLRNYFAYRRTATRNSATPQLRYLRILVPMVSAETDKLKPSQGRVGIPRTLFL